MTSEVPARPPMLERTAHGLVGALAVASLVLGLLVLLVVGLVDCVVALDTRYPDAQLGFIYWLNLGVLGAALASLLAGARLRGRQPEGRSLLLALCWIWPIVLPFSFQHAANPWRGVATLFVCLLPIQGLLLWPRSAALFSAPSARPWQQALVAAGCALVCWSAAAVVAKLAFGHTPRIQAGILGDVTELRNAQITYAKANGGAFEGRLECLVKPGTCLPWPSGGPLLSDSLATRRILAPASPRTYRLEFVAGAPLTAEERKAASATSMTSVKSFTLVATPVFEPPRSAERYCADGVPRSCILEAAASVQSGVACPPPPACRDLPD